jgi:hypothetical protein
MVSLSGLDVAPCRLPLLVQFLLVREERQTVLFSIVGHLLAARRSLGGLGGSIVHDRIIIVSSVCQCLLIPDHSTKLFRAVDIAPKDRDVIIPMASRMFVPEPQYVSDLVGDTAPILAASSDLHHIDVVLLIDLAGQPVFDAQAVAAALIFLASELDVVLMLPISRTG